MSEPRSFAQELMKRRVPQLVGVYIGAMWLVIELGDWVTERFGLPATLTSYVFVGMLVLLPAVLLFAYNHGAPGRDRWTRTEKIFIPLNVVIAFGAMYLVSPRLDAEAAIETVRITDEEGVVQEFEVAREGFHQELLAFYWRNDSGDSSLDWLSYGLPIMLAHDLNRVSPLITAITPLDSASLRSRLQSQGAERLLDVSRGLAIEVTRDRWTSALMIGRFGTDGQTLTVDVSLIDVDSGDTIGSFVVTADDWMEAVDVVSAQTLDALGIVVADNQSDDPVSEHFSDSLEAVRHYTAAQVAIELDNDYAAGIAELEAAIEIDPAFAEAGKILSVVQHLSGNTESARETATLALRNGYRLSEESKFILKANRYIFDGEFARGERVLEIWTEIQPNSTRAFENLASLARVRGGDQGLDKAMAAYERLLELDPGNLGVLRQQAALEQQRGNYPAAADFLRRYLDAVPDSAEAHMQLSQVYQAQGDFDDAQSALEDAAILSDEPVNSGLGLARLEARRGFYDAAEQRLGALREQAVNAEQRVLLLNGMAEIAIMRGRMLDAMALVEESNEEAKTLLPPAVRLLSFESQQAMLLALVGRKDEAIALTDKVAAQLQAPLLWNLNLNYLAIYETTEDRDRFRDWLAQTAAVENQLSDVVKPFLLMYRARLAIWDGDNDAAVAALDQAKALLGRSYLQVLQGNLTTSQIYVDLAERYLDAGAVAKAKAELESILKVFPSYAYAKLMLARTLALEADEDAARALVDEAISVWADADEQYLELVEARRLAAGL